MSHSASNSSDLQSAFAGEPSAPVRKAVFPVAGLGTRFLPATKASPKEMLPIVDKPLIQYAVEEAASAGITEMIFITGRSKRAIEDHFDKAYELEAELEAKGKQELLQLVRSVAPSSINCIYIRQPEALGQRNGGLQIALLGPAIKTRSQEAIGKYRLIGQKLFNGVC
jgi:UTP--glucose-1-phosphate uridylyltransferase